jgi:ArsR family transcriptional regulator
MQLLLSAHPHGLVVTEIQENWTFRSSTLSHHLEKLKAEDLVKVRRESTFLRYTANTEALQELLQFLYAECCTRNKAVKPEQIIQIWQIGGYHEHRRHQGSGQRKIRASRSCA